MPLYGPKFSETDFRGGKNILASEHLQFIEGGATLDATKFPVGYNDVGKLVARNTTTGKFEAVAEVEDLTGYDNFGILNVDFENDGETDLIAGEVIVRGSVYEAKLADAVPDAFKAANPLIRYVNHI
jgi:hypothetical protein